MYDVIVVGAGTAGCMAAKILASEGYDVCLIDRKDQRQIGDKVCGDAIGKHHFDNLGLPYPSGDEKEGDINGVKVYSPDKRTIFRISGSGLTGFMINRHLFGQRLLRYAVDSGAELKDGIHVSKPIIKDGYVIGVSARRLKTGEKIEFLGRVTVDASGVSAVIRRKLPSIMGVDVNVEPEDLVVCYREIRKLKMSIEEPEFCEIYLSQRIAPGGYYWIFPKTEGRVNVGLGVSQTRREANPKIQLYKNVISEPIFESSEIIDSGGGIVPTRRPLDSLVGNGVVFIGDSGCQVNPIHGGGIGPSMMGGKISGEVISEALEKGDSVILDATFVTQALRRRAAEIAAKHNKTLVILQTHCPQEVAIARILRRTQENYESNALTEQAYLNNKKKFEEVDVDDLKRLYPRLNIIHLTVDTQYDPPEDWYIIGMEKG